MMLKNIKYPSNIENSTFDGGTEYHSVLSATYVSAAVNAAPHKISDASVIGDKILSNTPARHISANGIHAATSLTQKSQYGVQRRSTNLFIR